MAASIFFIYLVQVRYDVVFMSGKVLLVVFIVAVIVCALVPYRILDIIGWRRPSRKG